MATNDDERRSGYERREYSEKERKRIEKNRARRAKKNSDEVEPARSRRSRTDRDAEPAKSAAAGRKRTAAAGASAAGTAQKAAAKNGAAPKKKSANTKKKKKKKTSVGKRTAKGIFIVLLSLIVLLGLAGGAFATYAVMTADEIDPSKIYDQLDTTSLLFDDQGEELQAVSSAESRTIVTYEQLNQNPNLINAFVAIEDKTFFTHKGFNFVRIIGAIKNSVFSGGEVSGTSTLTQQLARNLYLSSERSYTRKIQEAYYTMILERELSKEDIITAYLNTIFLGYNASGVEAASQAYFGCSTSELSIAQCAVLAAIPKSPNKYAPLKKYLTEEVTADPDDIIAETADGVYTIVYNDAYKDRQHLVLKEMLDQGLITNDDYILAMDEDIKVELNPSDAESLSVSSYFTDYCVDEVTNDLIKKYDISEDDAQRMIYNGGLRIYTSLNVSMQKTAEAEFEKNSNFPSVTGLTRDKSGNILNSKGGIMLYSMDTYFNSDDSFSLSEDEYKINSDGSLVLLKGHRLNIYSTETDSGTVPQIEFKNVYHRVDGVLYTINGGYFKYLDATDLSTDSEGNAIISRAFLDANPGYFVMDGNKVTIDSAYFTLRQDTIQPQGAMVVTDYHNGQIKVMVGGRSLTGKLLYNRANTTRQPGSSIKPIAVYAPALQSGVDLDTGYTAGTTIPDEEMKDANGNVWPKNWYHGYRGNVTLRTCVEQSINTTAVRTVKDIGLNYSVKYLKANGISSIVESGDANDMNPAALGLGGMTKGISPIEMASAYGTFPNGGEYIEPTTYITVEDSQGNVILSSDETSEKKQVYDEGVAWIMTDILKTTVSNGIAGRASFSGQPVGGKTGTTTDNYDAWFVGFTPQYAAAVWIGNDVNVELSQGSGAAASLWSTVMRQLCAGQPRGSYAKMPSNVYVSGGEYYVDGTKRTGMKADYESGDKVDDDDDSDPDNPADENEQTDEQTNTDNNGTNNNGNTNGNTGGNTGNTGGNTGGGGSTGGGGGSTGGGGGSTGGGGGSTGGGGGSTGGGGGSTGGGGGSTQIDGLVDDF